MEKRRLRQIKRQVRREERGPLWPRLWPVLVCAVMTWGLVFVAAHQVIDGDTGVQPVCELVEMPR